MNLKTLVGFLAGAVFVLGLVVTCGQGNKGAIAGGNSAWEYAYYTGRGVIVVPPTATAPNILSCNLDVACVLNAMGAEGWELVLLSGDYYYLKRPK